MNKKNIIYQWFQNIKCFALHLVGQVAHRRRNFPVIDVRIAEIPRLSASTMLIVRPKLVDRIKQFVWHTPHFKANLHQHQLGL